MKKILSVIALVSIATIAIAQPTVTAPSGNPVAGEKFYQHNCDISGVTNGSAGPHAAWDLSFLSETSLDSLDYSACAGTAYCDTFPGSTLAHDYGSGDIEYYNCKTSALEISGEGLTGGSLYYPDPQSLMVYPMTMGTVVVDSYMVAEPAYGLTITGLDTFIGDGYGKLILPSGTYKNVVRVHIITQTFDSTAGGMYPSSHDTADVYMWYTPGFHNPLAVMYYSRTAGVSTLEGVSYYTNPFAVLPLDVKEINEAKEVQVYPNPATNNVHIRFSATNKEQVTILLTDMVGRVVGNPLVSIAFPGVNDISYNTATLKTGMYMIRIQTGTETIIRKLEIVK